MLPGCNAQKENLYFDKALNVEKVWVQSEEDSRFYAYGECLPTKAEVGARFVYVNHAGAYRHDLIKYPCPEIITVYVDKDTILGCNASDFTDTVNFTVGKLKALRGFGVEGTIDLRKGEKMVNKETPCKDITVEQAWARITDEVMTNREFAVAWERELEFIYGAVFAAKDLTEAQKVPMAMRYLFPEYMPAHKGLYYYLRGGMSPVAKAANKET